MRKFINWQDIDLKGKTSGQKKFKCPACSAQRTNKQDKSLSVDITKGVAKCHYCDAVSIRDFGKNKTGRKYKLPSQNWKNYTKLSDKVVAYYENTRKISQSTLIACRVTEEKHYQPALGKEVNNIVYNYFEGESLVNKKYRSGNKKFTQSAGTKNIFYGINDIIGEKEVYIVEGEEDKHALYEIGIKNCISVPNGANDNDDVWENSKTYLEGVERFIIATDCDDKGNELAFKIAHRLGKWRCVRVQFKNKDANDDLIEGREVLENSIKNPKKFPVNGTFTAKDLQTEIFSLYEDGMPKTIFPKHRSFGNLKNVFTTMRGHLVTITGIPSHGKSAFTEWYVLNLVNDHNLKASFFSPEHLPMELHHSTFAQKYWAKNFFFEPRISKDEVQQYIDWADEKIYFTCPENGDFPSWDWLFDKFKEQVYAFGIDIFVIDAFNKVSFNQKGDKLDLIGETLSKLTMFAQMHDVIVFLVAHPTKMKKNDRGVYEMPTLYDVSGSADFRNQTHDGFCIYRYFGDPEIGTDDCTEFVNLKTKFSFQGKMTEKVAFEYHLPSGRYYVKGTEPETAPLSEFHNPQKKTQFPTVNPQQAFAGIEEDLMDNSDIPF